LKVVLGPGDKIATPPANGTKNCIQAKHAKCHDETKGLRVLQRKEGVKLGVKVEHL